MVRKEVENIKALEKEEEESANTSSKAPSDPPPFNVSEFDLSG